tara:strand:+ start:880 stop:1398 length:519 start_codon:yes stop_codon:yes gene_type:complete
MAIAKAEGNLSFKVLPDEIRKRLNGEISYTGADTSEKWVYAKVQVVYNKDNILAGAGAVADDDYLMAPGTSVGVADKYRFLIIKHTGWTDSNENIKSVYGVMIAIDAGTPAYNDANLIFLAPGDTIALKLPNLTVEGLHARTCSIVSGVPSADGTSGQNALIEVAAILDDVA